MVSAGCEPHRIGEMEERDLAVTLARGRIAFGVVSLLAPGLLARTMAGGDESEGGTRLFVRMVGARDLAVGLGLQVALHRDAPTRGWLEASAVIDAITSAEASSPAPSAWQLPERCSAPGWRANSTAHPPRRHSMRANERTLRPREGSYTGSTAQTPLS
jgi:hypothetical protein